MSEPASPSRGRRTATVVWTLVALVLTGLVLPALSPFLTDWIRSSVNEQGIVPFWLQVLRVALIGVWATCVLTLVLTVVVAPWRRSLWVPIWTRAKGLWPVTRARYVKELTAADAAGYERHVKEVEAERARTPKPTLAFDQRGPGQDDHIFMMRNYGYPIYDVEVTVNEHELVLRSPAFWRGAFGNDQPGGIVGHHFEGDLTELGKLKGVTFTVTYTDQNGDRKTENHKIPPEKLHVNKKESPKEAYKRGFAAGRAELQAEIDKQRARPTVKPQWLLGRTGEDVNTYLISNTAVGSTAKDVVIEAPPMDFTFVGAPQWDDLSVPAGTENVVEVGSRIFKAHVREGGVHFGVLASISWTDENGDRWVSHQVPIAGTERRRGF